MRVTPCPAQFPPARIPILSTQFPIDGSPRPRRSRPEPPIRRVRWPAGAQLPRVSRSRDRAGGPPSLPTRRSQKHREGLGHRLLDGAGTGQIDLDEYRVPGGDGIAYRFGHGARSVQAAVNFRPFQQGAVVDQLLKATGRHEVVVDPVDFAGPGALVVAETLKCRSGIRSRRQRTSVDLPTADGPDSTTTRPVAAARLLSGAPSVLNDSPGRRRAHRPALPQALRPASSPEEAKPNFSSRALRHGRRDRATPGRGDLQLGHDFLRLDLAHLWQGLRDGQTPS